MDDDGGEDNRHRQHCNHILGVCQSRSSWSQTQISPLEGFQMSTGTHKISTDGSMCRRAGDQQAYWSFTFWYWISCTRSSFKSQSFLLNFIHEKFVQSLKVLHWISSTSDALFVHHEKKFNIENNETCVSIYWSLKVIRHPCVSWAFFPWRVRPKLCQFCHVNVEYYMPNAVTLFHTWAIGDMLHGGSHKYQKFHALFLFDF